MVINFILLDDFIHFIIMTNGRETSIPPGETSIPPVLMGTHTHTHTHTVFPRLSNDSMMYRSRPIINFG